MKQQDRFDEQRALWLYEHYCWLERSLPPRSSPTPPVVIFATKAFFPDPYHGDHPSAVRVFDRVRDLMGVLDWPCRLEGEDEDERKRHSDLGRAGILGTSSSHGAAGTFSAPDETGVVISYSSSLLKDPVGLVAIFAHELCHYLLATVEDEPPGTWEALEPLTDLAAVVEGFGIFLADAAFRFTQWTDHDQQGWSAQRTGYLSEVELGFALAIFSMRNGADAPAIARALKPNAREIFRDALDYVADLEATGKGGAPGTFSV